MTRAPSRASPVAIANPMPLVEPETRAVLSVSFKSIIQAILPYSSIRVYRALKKMFYLDAERHWQSHPELIDNNCWRETSRDEIARMAEVELRTGDNHLVKL